MFITSKLLPPNFSFRLFGLHIIGDRRKKNRVSNYPILLERRRNIFGRLYQRSKRRLSFYLLAILLIFTTFLIELLLEPHIPLHESPFLIYFAAVVVAAMLGGMGVGWFATLLAALVTDFHLRGLGNLAFNPEGYYLRLTTFIFECVFVSILVDRLKTSQQQALLKADILQGSEHHLRNVLNSLFAFVGVMTPEGILVEVNQAALSFGKLRLRDVVARPFESVSWWSYSQESKSKLRRAIAKAATGKVVRYDALLRLSNSRYVTMDFSIAPVMNSEGKVIYLIASGVDVTDRIKALAINKGLVSALEKEKERIESIIKNVPGVVWEIRGRNFREKTSFTYISDYVEEMTGYTFEDIKKLGMPSLIQIVHPDDKDMVMEFVRSSFHKNKNGLIKCRLITKTGKVIWAETHFTISHDENGIPAGAMGVSLDITENQKLEMMKDEFVSIASHELKTPITTVKAFTQILEKRLMSAGDEVSTQYLRKMNEYISRLTKIIYDFLDFSKIQAGKLEYAKEEVEIGELVNEVVKDMQSTSDTHKIVAKGSSKAIIEGDRTRISQVIINLISNAIKYSPEADRVVVEMKDNSHNVEIKIKDFGIGISQEGQRKLFERFYRVSNPKKIKIEGFGLGLYISKEIVKRHGGDIGVDSAVGKGSTFLVHLPIKRYKNN